WRSYSYGYFGDPAKNLDALANGGANSTMVIAPDGRSEVDFTGMDPVIITVQLNGNTIQSHLTYSGKISGRLKLPPAGQPSGQWEAEQGVNGQGVRITLDTNGISVLHDEPLANLTGAAAASNNTQPLMGAGTYTCYPSGQKLEIRQQVGKTSALWELRR